MHLHNRARVCVCVCVCVCVRACVRACVCVVYVHGGRGERWVKGEVAGLGGGGGSGCTETPELKNNNLQRKCLR